MSVFSFFHDLGIIPNNGTGLENDPSLLQGQELMQYERLYTKQVEPHLKLLQITSIPGINSIVETMDYNDSTQSSKTNDSKSVSKLEEEFNKTLIEYTNTYQIFSEDLLKNSSEDRSQYFNKTVTTGDGNYIYVNDYGFTHRYSTDAWKNNCSSCPNDAIDISVEDLSKLSEEAPMGLGQPCKVAGNNVINNDTKEVAWVDIKGYKHPYTESLWKQKDSTCNIKPIPLSAKQYNAIPSKNNMSSSTVCNQIDIDPVIWHKLTELNNKLLILAQELNKELDSLKVTDTKLQNSLNNQKNVLNEHVNTLSDNKNNINQINNNFETVLGKREDSELSGHSSQLQYMVWTILAITILILTINTLTGNIGNITNGFVVIISLIAIYIFAKWLYNKL